MSRRTPLRRSALKGAALLAAAFTVAGGGAGAALAAPAGPAHPAHPRAASLVPLSQLGPGWSIVETSAASAPMVKPVKKGKTTLYAVSPQGKKFPFFSWPASTFGASSYLVIDWSGDKQRVLVQNFFNRFEQISLVTGKVINSFKLPDTVNAIGYTRPDGKNILAFGNGGIGISRYNLQGKLQVKLSKTGFGAIESPDGTSVIIEASYGLEQVSNTGGVIRKLHAPIATGFCTPVRWWNSTTILSQCQAKHEPSAPRLWLFPVNGGKVTALTAQRSGKRGDLGDIDGWKLSSGVYLQALGPCGVEFVANLAGQKINLPGVSYPSDNIITGQGSSLLVQADNGCFAGSSLVWFNPQTKKVTWVVRTPKNVNGVMATVPFGRPLS
jgi:hypothetical protein